LKKHAVHLTRGLIYIGIIRNVDIQGCHFTSGLSRVKFGIEK